MVQGTAWMSITCVMFLLSCSCEPTTAKELEDDKKPWLMLPVMNHNIRESGAGNIIKSQDQIEEITADEMVSNVVISDEDIDDEIGLHKRVFLSRGWGPGGYEAPSPPPQRFVRRPPAFQPPRTKIQENRPTPGIDGDGGVRYAALVSPQQLQQSQQKPQYRRFHSIFTSGTWSPLGKRSDVINENIAFKNYIEKYKSNNRPGWLGFILDDEGNIITNEDKRSGVFASSGWGAGGSSPPSRHPWIPHSTNTLSSPTFPRVISMTTGGSNSGGNRHKANFRTNTLHQEDKPLLHLFVSHGWGPMGR